MAYEQLRAYGIQVLDEQPTPLRQLDWRILTRSILLDKVSILLFLFGLFGLLSAIGWSLSLSDDDVVRIIVVGMTLGGVGVFGGAPLWVLWRWACALRRGRVAYARVVQIRDIVAGTPISYDTIAHGAVSGWWEVVLPERTITAAFTLDQAWARSVWIGSRVRVLVHPTKPTILLPIGP